MRKTSQSRPRILLADSSSRRRGLRAAAISADDRLVILAEVQNLTDAYNLTELEQPALVVMTEDLAGSPDFAMYAALLQCLSLPLLILGPRQAHHWAGPLMPRFFVLDDREQGAGLGDSIADALGLSVQRPLPISAPASADRVVVIGASTGGVEALLAVLGEFPADCPPTLVVQHIRPDFLSGLVRRLDRNCRARVVEARDGAGVTRGLIQLAPGSERHLEIEGGSSPRCRLVASDPVSGHRPSVDTLFRSAVAFGDRAVGALLTGMGRDGAEGLAEMRRAGSWTIAQDRASSIVYGMPRAAVELGGVAEELPLNRIGRAILSACHAPGAMAEAERLRRHS